MASPAHTAMLGVIALLVAACHPPLPQEIIEKGHIRYHYWKDDEPPCDEALEQLSARVSDLELLWQQEIPAGVTIDYFKLKSGEGATISDFCPAYAAACTVGTQIYATSWAEPHEVVHAVASTIGAPPEFMREGLAVVYGCAVARWSGDPVDPEQVATNIEASAWTATMARGSAELYPSAAAVGSQRDGTPASQNHSPRGPHAA